MLPNGLIAGAELHELIEQRVINANHRFVNAASIDVRLGNTFYFEAMPTTEPHSIIDLEAKGAPAMRKWVCQEGAGVHLHPGDFCLASTIETFYLPPTISAMFILRSSMARAGLEHMQAGWADAGWHDSVLTLELVNILKHHTLRLKPGMRVGQMVFFRHADAGENTYAIKGNYNHTRNTTTAFEGQE